MIDIVSAIALLQRCLHFARERNGNGPSHMGGVPGLLREFLASLIVHISPGRGAWLGAPPPT